MPPIPSALQEDSRTEEEDEEEEEPSSFLKRKSSSIKHSVYSDTRTSSSVDLCDASERISSSLPERSDSDNNNKTTTTKSKKEPDPEHFYLQSNSCSVPNSKSVSSPFQRAENQNCISSSTCEQSNDNSVCSDKIASCSESSSHSDRHHPLFSCAKPTCVQVSLSSSNSTNQSNGSSHELRRCNWHQCHSSLEGNDELVEHIRSQHVQVQKEKESFVCLWEGCKVNKSFDFFVIFGDR